jgi:hypothetical protein
MSLTARTSKVILEFDCSNGGMQGIAVLCSSLLERFNKLYIHSDISTQPLLTQLPSRYSHFLVPDLIANRT